MRRLIREDEVDLFNLDKNGKSLVFQFLEDNRKKECSFMQNHIEEMRGKLVDESVENAKVNTSTFLEGILTNKSYFRIEGLIADGYHGGYYNLTIRKMPLFLRLKNKKYEIVTVELAMDLARASIPEGGVKTSEEYKTWLFDHLAAKNKAEISKIKPLKERK